MARRTFYYKPSKPQRWKKMEVSKTPKNKSYNAMVEAAEALCAEHGLTFDDVTINSNYYGRKAYVFAYVPESDESFAKRLAEYEKEMEGWKKQERERKEREQAEKDRQAAAALAAKAKEQKDLVKLIAAAMTTDPSLAKKALKIVEENK